MPHHVVALTWNDDVPSNHHETVTKVLYEMVTHIPSVRDYKCGPDLGVSAPTNADYLIVATFDDVEGWRAYDENALHNEVRAKFFKPYIATRAAIQIEI